MTPRAQRSTPCTPHDAVAVMMRAVFGDTTHEEARADLAAHQIDGVARLRVLLERYGGALLCDSVGLGKTHTAAAIISGYAGHPVLVTAPAQLKDHWRRHLRRVRGWHWLSHTGFSRRAVADRSDYALIVVDEAHAFRNPATRRYAALSRTIDDARILLLTATPVNNSPADLYHLIRLFAADDTFAGIGITDLAAALEAARDGDFAELRRVASEIMVRRTRSVLADQSPAVRFPSSSGTELIRYDQHGDDPWTDAALQQIPRLSFAAFGVDRNVAAVELMRLSLLKRLESSMAAFRSSVLRLVALNQAFIDAAQAGLLFDVRTDAQLVTRVGGSVQLALHELALRRWPAGRDPDSLVRAALRDQAVLNCVTHHLRTARDAKLARLTDLVTSELADDKIVIFTEFRATAEAIHQALARTGRVALIHGGAAVLGVRPSTRSAVIRRFAPCSAALPVNQRSLIDDVRVLIATDVLAEGMNLQDARVVVSYDLPWNPVRLAQRAGRIDRMASPHTGIRVIAFTPYHGLERVMRLVRRIRRKIRVIRALGGDAPASFHSAAITDAVSQKELARAEFLRSRDVTDSVCAPPARAAMHADIEAPAVICCISDGLCPRLVLVGDDLAVVADDVQIWKLLRTAMHCRSGVAVQSPLLGRAERAALRTPPAPLAHAHAHPVATRAARVVRRWLASLPGGPAPPESATADRALTALQAPTSSLLARLPAILAGSPDEVVRALQLHPAPSVPRPDDSRVLASILFLPLEVAPNPVQGAPRPG